MYLVLDVNQFQPTDQPTKLCLPLSQVTKDIECGYSNLFLAHRAS